ncbi:MAG TPA: class I adenylate-forming enzyme family protein [Stellaceae bacterium]|nr:class I adenylate-forming enzyme family protein [Stellaceae bacterium]
MPHNRTLCSLLREQTDRFGDRPAVVSHGQATSYRALADAASRVAGGLAARGIGRGARVGILAENRREWLEAAFGAATLGAVAVPLSTWSREGELDYLIGDATLDALFAVESFGGQDFAAALARLQPEHQRLRTVVMIGEARRPDWLAYDEFIAAAEPMTGDDAGPRDDAFILYTSGSSARPKAVRLQHGATVENGFNIGERMALTENDRVLLAPPLFWAYGAVNALPAALTHGAALVLQPRFEAGGWLDLIERQRCTAIYTLPSMTGAAIRHPEFRRERLASLRTGLMIGSPEEVRIAATGLGAAQICNIYGATETYGNCAVTPAGWPLDRRMVSQGPPLPGMRIRIVDPETGRALPANEAGAVEVAGLVTAGYCGASAEHNQAAFTADGYFRTGDIGLLDADGDFRFVARGSDIIKRAGINVSPAEVETLLLRHAAVAQAAVVGAPAGERGEAIVAFVVPAPGSEIDGEALRQHCRALASAYKVPDRIEICAALPATETGKIFRRGLKDQAAALLAAAPSGQRRIC